MATVGLCVFLLRGRIYTLVAEHELSRARRLLAANASDQADAALLQALRWRPALGEARGLLAASELRRRQVDQAFLDFQSLTELQPDNADGWLGLAQVRLSAGQPEEAAAAMDSVIEVAPNRPGARTMRSELRYQLGQYQAAYADAERAIRLDPKDARAWTILVQATNRTKGPVAALEAAQRGVGATGGDATVLREISLLRQGAVTIARSEPRLREDSGDRAERWPGALGSFMREFVAKLEHQDWNAAAALAASAHSKYPGTFLGPWLEGLLELTLGHLDKAEKQFLAALAWSPRSHRALTNLVAVWWKLEGPRYAGDRLVALNKRDPGFEYPLPIAAHAYLEADQPAEAESTARLSFAALPGSAVPYRQMAELYVELDRASDALGVCEEGLSLFPDNASLLLLQARAAILLGNHERAIAAYERVLVNEADNQGAAGALAALLLETRTDAKSHQRALELVRRLELDGPLDSEVLGVMGRVYLKVADDSLRARTYLEAAIQGAPSDPSLRFYLALALKSASTPLAIQQLRSALALGQTFPEEVEARRVLQQLGGDTK
jgi:tetratricopeptide (TPR) repeat protein